ncbi:tail fiber domain-containing protein [Bradyrhizobium sp. sGM-13]|uniref:tail fiber domain-containing protein n=1 Tax=Bradyrhizobium sp. sGM-13 TaxID=2831781 RepID=UPI001BCECC28|nr:tail fiber domain-containing protein [Bradyrhizobium sp. sGM-13]
MGCFGSSEETGRKTTTNTLPAYLESAAQTNVSNAMNFANKPFEAYTGEMTAPLTQNQKDAFGLIKSIAGSSNPYLSDIQDLYKQFSTAPASTITAPTTGEIEQYMNPYLMAALQPQLDDIARQGINTRKSLDAQSTMDGAFGDARSGVERAEARRNEDILRTNTIGKGYSDAFTSAMANLMDTKKTNATLNETALQRAITGGKALQDLDLSQVNRGLTTADALAKAGKTEQETNQAADTAKFQEFLRGQGWDAQKIALVTSALAGTPKSTTQTTVEEQPNNSGWGIIGSLTSSLLPAIISDRRVKEDISVIGATLDGLPIYRFKYIGDDRWQIGLMADDVEAVTPDAVMEVGGLKVVDYEKATQAAADMGASV